VSVAKDAGIVGRIAEAAAVPGQVTRTVSISLCVCSARPELVAAKIGAWRGALACGDEILVVFDTPRDPTRGWTCPHAADSGTHVNAVWLGAARGLSPARMRALELASSRHVLFMDDDAVAPAATLEAIRRALAGGARAVGVRLEPAFESCTRPWYLTDGVLHYVGVHSESTLGSVWGACFAVDREFARANGISFRPELGRRGRQLQSGDDSSFVQRIRECEGTVVFLPGASAIHSIGAKKCSLGYLLRRAWWQGRSEVRRGDWREGLVKELGRIRSSGSAPARLCIVPAFTGAVVAGMATELTLAGCLADRRRVQTGTEPEVADPERTCRGPNGYAYDAGIPEP
jgi:hypothetical protein